MSQKITSFSFIVLLRRSLGVSLYILWSILYHAGGHCWQARYTHAVTAWSAGSCLHYKGTLLTCLPSAVQEGPACPFLQMCSAPSQSCCTPIIRLEFLVASHDQQGSNIFFLNKMPPDFYCSFYILMLICFLCRIISSKWVWCISKDSVASSNNAFLGLAILFHEREKKTPKCKLVGEKKRFPDITTVNALFQNVDIPALQQKQSFSTLQYVEIPFKCSCHWFFGTVTLVWLKTCIILCYINNILTCFLNS